jgi:alginate O-acetyltransferase complex protein AlgI
VIFNSLAYFFFFVAVCSVQYLPLSWRTYKVVLVLFSYAFYAAWYPITIVLLWLSTLFDYTVAHGIERAPTQRRKRTLLLLSLTLNLGVLSLFKYGSFAVENLNALSSLLGWGRPLETPSLPLPVGISFYTFMSLAYVIDVYRGQQRASSSFLDFALFLTFYPHLVAGPIVRAQDFLPQCATRRRADLRAMTWGISLLALGLFQKVVLADSWFGPVADRAFASAAEGHVSSKDAWVGALSFSGQILCDFSGYSTCAVGAAACIGFRLPQNFRSPYAAVGFSDFWRRWHISLSSWLRDYLYVSLGGNRLGQARTLFNLMLTMLIGGLWHGPSWTFVIWGGLHGLFLCAERGVKRLMAAIGLVPGKLLAACGWLCTFVLVSWAWVFFRAPTFSAASAMTRAMVGLSSTRVSTVLRTDAAVAMLGVVGVLIAHHLTRRMDLEHWADRTPRWLYAGALACVVVAIVTMAGQDRAFIYFQF